MGKVKDILAMLEREKKAAWDKFEEERRYGSRQAEDTAYGRYEALSTAHNMAKTIAEGDKKS